jgi:hypothetical protein
MSMTEFKGTPGDWRADGLTIESFLSRPGRPGEVTIVAEIEPVNGLNPEEEQTANARAIAAVPKMIAVLTWIAENASAVPGDMARQALAAALGD